MMIVREQNLITTINIFLEKRKSVKGVYGQPATIYAGCVILEKSAVLVSQKES